LRSVDGTAALVELGGPAALVAGVVDVTVVVTVMTAVRLGAADELGAGVE
jgi:hypothetical protein